MSSLVINNKPLEKQMIYYPNNIKWNMLLSQGML